MLANFSKHAAVSTWAPLAALVGVWILMLVVANPTGNFPLNDDWNYARSVKALLDEHQLLITHWSLAASVTHIFIGYLACLQFGFSFSVLRVVNTIVAVLCSALVFSLLRKQRAAAPTALVGALCFAANPLFFDLANTFMTDITLLLTVVLLLRCFVDLLQNPQPEWRDMTGATIASVAACLCRQTGIVVPLAYLIVRGCSKKDATTTQSSAKRTFLAAIPTLASAVAIGIFEAFVHATIGTPHAYVAEKALYLRLLSSGPLAFSAYFLKNFLSAGIYLGLFLSPLIAVCFVAFLNRLRRDERVFASVLMLEVGLSITIGLAVMNSLLPLADNVMFSGGLGPVLLPELKLASAWPSMPQAFWLCMTLIGTLGAGGMLAMLAVLVLRKRRGCQLFETPAEGRLVRLCLVAAGSYLVLICLRGFFDRYLLFPMLLLVPVVYACSRVIGEQEAVSTSASRNRLALIAGSAILLLLGAYSAVAVHDFFTWNRVRWQVLNTLTAAGKVAPLDIDGGLEFNSWYAYEPSNRRSLGFDPNSRPNAKFALSFERLPQFGIIGSYKFRRWLPAGEGTIYLLRRTEPVASRTEAATSITSQMETK